MKSFSKSVQGGNTLSEEKLFQLLKDRVPGLVRVEIRRTRAQDKAGIDYILHRRFGRSLYADLKEVAYIPSSPSEDRVLLETEICGRTRSKGWATDAKKKTDVIVVVRGDSSVLIYSARRVRAALRQKLHSWKSTFKTGWNDTRGFYEIFRCFYILVPRAVLDQECHRIARAWSS